MNDRAEVSRSASKHGSPTSYIPQLQGRTVGYRLLVIANFVIVGAMIANLQSPGHMFSALAVQLCGVSLGLSTILANRGFKYEQTLGAEDALLVRHGPYTITRHPMDTALLLFSASYLLSDGSWASVQLWGCLLATLLTKVHFQERMLCEFIPSYRDCTRDTARLIPFLW